MKYLTCSCGICEILMLWNTWHYICEILVLWNTWHHTCEILWPGIPVSRNTLNRCMCLHLVYPNPWPCLISQPPHQTLQDHVSRNASTMGTVYSILICPCALYTVYLHCEHSCFLEIPLSVYPHQALIQPTHNLYFLLIFISWQIKHFCCVNFSPEYKLTKV